MSIAKVKSEELTSTNNSRNLPSNATIREEYVRCGKLDCPNKHGPDICNSSTTSGKVEQLSFWGGVLGAFVLATIGSINYSMKRWGKTGSAFLASSHHISNIMINKFKKNCITRRN